MTVPKALRGFEVIGGHDHAPDTIYMRSLWWRADGRSFYFFVRVGSDINDATAIVQYMLKSGAVPRGHV